MDLDSWAGETIVDEWDKWVDLASFHARAVWSSLFPTPLYKSVWFALGRSHLQQRCINSSRDSALPECYTSSNSLSGCKKA